MSQTALLTLADIQSAAETIKPYVVRTPLLESEVINDLLCARILFKAENLQKTGAFKYRGATHFLSKMTPEARSKGVVAYSSGNHAQALAAAARLFKTTATIVMPTDAPEIKISGTRYYGANLVLYNRHTENREALAQRIADETGATMIPPFDHHWIMAGQGTVGIELFSQLDSAGASPERVYIPCSGGGLLAGTGTAMKALCPEIQIWGIEPTGFDDTLLSLKAGRVQSITPKTSTLCDALALTRPGQHTFAVNQRLLTGIQVVSDNFVKQAIRLLFEHLKLVVEPGGAIGLAALLQNPEESRGQTIAIILSGGNVDPAIFSQILTGSN